MSSLRIDLLNSAEKLELEAILLEMSRRKIRSSFREYCVHALAPLGHAPAPHHDLIIRELEAVAAGRTPRLMLNLPPGSAKSTYASVLFPAWCLSQRKHLKIIAASNTAKLAERFSRSVLDQVRENGDVLGFSVDRGGVEMWDTTNGGAYRSAGVGGTITGFRCDLALVDDPVKSRAEAESE
ncbi:MAG: Large terminase subunit, partial [Rhodoferax sp.]|nr:Large terminase subunit [Rhodoferax sp.]